MTANSGLAEGLRRKDESLGLLAVRRAGLMRRAQRALLQVLLARGRATVDDVRRLVDCPEGVCPKVFGAMAGELARARIIEQDGFAKSTRPEAHARPVSVWRLINRTTAEEWLATHPELLEAETTEAASAPTDTASMQRSLFA
jgi:hypothetical protein